MWVWGLWERWTDAYETEFLLLRRYNKRNGCLTICPSVRTALIMGNICVESWVHIPLDQHALSLCYPYTSMDANHHLLFQPYFPFFLIML